MKKTIIILPILIVIAVVGTYAVNYFQLQQPMNQAIQSDYRNDGIDVSVHYSNYVDPSTLVYDLRKVSGSNSASDVFRVLLQFADRIKTKRFSTIELAYKGKTKFKLEGYYFQTLGEEYGSQNPVYTMRTFPEHLKTPSGAEAYSGWTGGWLGVLNKQLEDFNDFHKRWYVSEF
jgi:hypothetical protein